MATTMIGLGELLWDLLPAGKQLGGAPANFAYHAHALGAEAWPVSRVGDDALGRELLDRLAALGLPIASIQVDPAAPTGTVSVELLRGGGSVLRSRDGVSELPGERVAIADTIGAGDAFTAAMALGRLAGWPLDVIHRRAHALATFVCTQSGATPELPDDLTAPFRGA